MFFENFLESSLRNMYIVVWKGFESKWANVTIAQGEAFSKSSLYIWKFSVQYCRSLAWNILSITLLACEMSTLLW